MLVNRRIGANNFKSSAPFLHIFGLSTDCTGKAEKKNHKAKIKHNYNFIAITIAISTYSTMARRWSSNATADLLEWVREQRESKQQMKSQSLHGTDSVGRRRRASQPQPQLPQGESSQCTSHLWQQQQQRTSTKERDLRFPDADPLTLLLWSNAAREEDSTSRIGTEVARSMSYSGEDLEQDVALVERALQREKEQVEEDKEQAGNTQRDSVPLDDEQGLLEESSRCGLEYGEEESVVVNSRKVSEPPTPISEEPSVDRYANGRDSDDNDDDDKTNTSSAIKDKKYASIPTTKIMEDSILTTIERAMAGQPQMIGFPKERAKHTVKPSSSSAVNDTMFSMPETPDTQKSAFLGKTAIQTTTGSFKFLPPLKTYSADDQPDLVPSNTEESEEDPAFITTDRYAMLEPPKIATGTKDISSSKMGMRHELAQQNANYSTNHTSLSGRSNSNGMEEKSRRETMAYLLRYETMDMQQGAEEIATINYVRPLLETLETLANKQEAPSTPMKASTTIDTTLVGHHESDQKIYRDLCTRTFTYGELKQALDVLESESSFSTQSSSPSPSSSGLVIQDSQFMMVLRILTAEKYAPSMDDNNTEAIVITWAEIIHCYRVCLLGMLTLKNLPKPSDVRSRTKERIMSQLSQFEMPAAKLLEEANANTNDAGKVLDRESPTAFDETTQFSIKASSKSNTSLVKVTTAVAVSVAVGFVSGVFYSDSSSADTTHILQNETNIEDRNYSEALESCLNLEPTELVLHAESVVPASARLPSISSPLKPVEEKKLLDFQKLSAATLIHMVGVLDQKESVVSEKSSSSALQELATPTQSEPDEQIKKRLWDLIPEGHKMAVSVILGATTPRLFLLARSAAAASSLSLGSIGLVPAGLVVVGVISLASNILKGIKVIRRRNVHQTKSP